MSDIAQESVFENLACFSDNRLETASCVLCGHDQLTIVRRENHAFGEMGMFTCSSCGACYDICNMVDKPQMFEWVAREMYGNRTAYTLRSILKSHSDYENMPTEHSKLAKDIAKAEAEIEEDERRVKCQNADCSKMFVRAPSAKSMLTLDYCPTCRKLEEIRSYCASCAEAEKKEKKAAKEKAKAAKERAAKAAKTRARNARKVKK